jgi:SAM-dependent methyltransferase
MIKSFSRWLTETALGRYLLQQEQAWFDRAVADAFGSRAVQIGDPQVDLLRKNRIAWRCRAGRKPVGADIVCDSAQLPFASASLDLLLMPHGLDFTIFPHQVLREVERVLVPEGRLIMTGFNPVSLWGVRRMVQGRTEAPWSGNFFPLLRVKDWLALLDLEPGGGAFIGYAPPVARADWLERCRFMEAAGDRWWPLAARRTASISISMSARPIPRRWWKPSSSTMPISAWRSMAMPTDCKWSMRRGVCTTATSCST